MKKIRNTKSGFTLIEVIATLILVGIMASIAGFGIVQATKSFLMAKEATALGPKNQIAMARIRKSIQSLINVTNDSSSVFQIQRYRDGVSITETYSLVGSDLMLETDSGGQDILLDNVNIPTGSSLFEYSEQNGSAWSLSSDSLGELASVAINLTSTAVGSSLTYSDRIVPRNTYSRSRPTGSAADSSGATGGSYSGCFITSLSFNSNSIFNTLIQIKNNFSITEIKFFVDRYYFGNYEHNYISRYILFPIATFFFILIYFPVGILLILMSSWLLTRLLLRSGVLHDLFYTVKTKSSGSVLIALIVTMLVITIMTGGIVSMYSSSTIPLTESALAQSAFYQAEAGVSHMWKAFADHTNDNHVLVDDQGFFDDLYLDNQIILGNNSFEFDAEGYWFKNEDISDDNGLDITVTSWGQFPRSLINAAGTTGYLEISIAGNAQTIVSYNDYSYNDVTGEITFENINATPILNEPVFPVCRSSSSTQYLMPTLIGQASNSDSTDDIQMDGFSNMNAFPNINGLVTFQDASGNGWLLLYEKKDGNTLTGLHHIAGMTVPQGGIEIAGDTNFTIGKYADFTITGHAGGTNSNNAIASQTLVLHQPLQSTKFYTRVTGGKSFDGDTNLETDFDELIGEHTIVTEDGNAALRVDGTDETYSYVTNNIEVFQAESLIAANINEMMGENDFLENLWRQSNNMLSYDLQAKIKFTQDEDDNSETSPTNYPGNYMPGISFRTKCEDNTDYTTCSYYGVSLMRGIQGITMTESGGNGCGGSDIYAESDEIPDYLYENHGGNYNFTVCDTDYDGWNDKPPLDGIPYLVLWQKDVTETAAGCGDEVSPWNWLTYTPLVEYKPTTIYYYEPLIGEFEWENIVGGANGTSTFNAPGFITEGTTADGNDVRNTKNFREPSSGCGGPSYRSYRRSYAAYKLKDKYNLFITTTPENPPDPDYSKEILGHHPPDPFNPGQPDGLVYDSSTQANPDDETAPSKPTTPVSKWNSSDADDTPVGFIIDPSFVENVVVNDQNDEITAAEFKGRANYRIYPKAWTTVLARLVELEGDFDCDADNGLERVNAISAYLADTAGDNSGSYGYVKDKVRRPYTRATSEDDIKWPEDGDYFTTVVWGEGLTDPIEAYSSKTVQRPSWVEILTGCGNPNVLNIVGSGDEDSEGDFLNAYTGHFTTENYGSSNPPAGAPWTWDTHNIYEMGMHTVGITNDTEYTPDDSEFNAETCYFDDFYWAYYRGGAVSVFPGIIEQ